jgi:pimeloyl-CoA synthetase
MDLIQRGWPSDDGDYQFMKVTIEEQAAQLETLRVLGVAIKQHRQILEEKRRYVAKMEMTIQFP